MWLFYKIVVGFIRRPTVTKSRDDLALFTSGESNILFCLLDPAYNA